MRNMFLAIGCLILVSCAHHRTNEIEQFVQSELQLYPEAHLIDLYKNYFQDAYGPGHLIPDTSSAAGYLDLELNDTVWTDTVLWQPLGINHDYYRVNLGLVKKGIIPRDTLLVGMVRSAKMARKPDIESWKLEWGRVEAVIKTRHPDLPDFEKEEKFINGLLAQGHVMVHHSSHYEQLYHPHYRIIHKTLFKEWQQQYFKSLNCSENK
jgi:hypothetical protein